MNTTLPKQAGDVASQVGDTMSDALSTGLELARDVVAAAGEHLPDGAADWTRQVVPGLTTERRYLSARRFALFAALLLAVVGGVWLLRRRSDVTAHVERDSPPATDRDRAGQAA
jgi:hypothetical protein